MFWSCYSFNHILQKYFSFFQMVVLMDPCDDPDDILRVNRSRERQYVFDLALGPAASQVGIVFLPPCVAADLNQNHCGVK